LGDRAATRRKGLQAEGAFASQFDVAAGLVLTDKRGDHQTGGPGAVRTVTSPASTRPRGPGRRHAACQGARMGNPIAPKVTAAREVQAVPIVPMGVIPVSPSAAMVN